MVIQREDDTEQRSGALVRFGENKAVVVEYDLSAEGKADAGAGIFSLNVQALKDLEYLFVIGRLKPDTVVGEEDLEIVKLRLKLGIVDDFDFRKFS